MTTTAHRYDDAYFEQDAMVVTVGEAMVVGLLDKAAEELVAGHDVVLRRAPDLTLEQATRLIETLLPSLPSVMSRPAMLQARRNAEDRIALAEEFGLLTATQVADRVGSRATNTSATAHRWRSRKEIFSVQWKGVSVYPEFQFDEEARPRAVISDVLRVVEDRLSGWELALWFTAADSWLDGQRPVDLLDTAPEDVVDAARRMALGPSA